MRDHDLRRRWNFLASFPIVEISDESLRCAANVEEIHRVRPDAWKLRSFVFARATALHSRDDFPDSTAAKAASAKGKCLVKASFNSATHRRDEFVDACE
jgi:hypothetical protein